MRIKLNHKEVDYLHLSQFTPSWLVSRIVPTAQMRCAEYILEISEEEADKFRDILGEQLQLEGFDQNYTPTKVGYILEDLIDKFFVP